MLSDETLLVDMMICAKMTSVAQLSKLKLIICCVSWDKMICEKLLHNEMTNDMCWEGVYDIDNMCWTRNSVY